MTDEATTTNRHDAPADPEDHDEVGPRLATRWIALAAATASTLVLAVTRITHAAVGTDAIAYIAVATSIEEGNGIGFWLEHPLTTWPPLWPAILAVGMRLTGWRGDVVAVFVNAALLAGCVVFGVALGRRVLRSRAVLAVLAASAAASPLLIGLAALVQTEIVFAMLALAIMWAILRAGEDSPAPRWLVLAGLLTATGFYVRYQAIYVVPVFAGWLVLRGYLRTRSPLRSLLPACWYTLAAVVPSAVWILRNLRESDTAMGPRFPSNVGPVENALGALRTIFKFVTSVPVAPLLPAAFVTLVGGIAAVVLLVRTTRPDGDEPGLGARTVQAFCGPVGLLTTFVAGFMTLMVISRSLVGFDDLDIRLLAPCLIPTSILVLRYAEIVFLDLERRRRLGQVLIGLWFVPQVVLTLALVGPANSLIAETGYNADRAVAAANSPALDALPDDCVLYSNNAADLYRSGLETFISPRHVEYKSSQRTHMLEDLVEDVDGGQRTCLVWVEYIEDDEVVSVAELSDSFRLERLDSADDVTVYELHPLD